MPKLLISGVHQERTQKTMSLSNGQSTNLVEGVGPQDGSDVGVMEHTCNVGPSKRLRQEARMLIVTASRSGRLSQNSKEGWAVAQQCALV